MILLLDIGNTHVHVGWARGRRVVRHRDFPTAAMSPAGARAALASWAGATPVEGVCLCSVVPSVTPHVRQAIRLLWNVPVLELNHRTLRGLGLNYPRPHTIGSDRLANAVAAFHRFGGPAVVVDFGTAVTFDVIDPAGRYAGGIIAPGLAAMTAYLHEKTALLPRIQIRDTTAVIGKNTRQAMLIGAVHGYCGLVRALIDRLKKQWRRPRLPVVATGGYAGLLARYLPEIAVVDPLLTLEGLRLTWMLHQADAQSPGKRKR